MTKEEIIKWVADNRMIETIISNVGKGTYPHTDDLAQDLYLELLEKPEEKLLPLYEKNQMNFYITRMVMNNLLSHNSRYYYNYIRWDERRSELRIKQDKDTTYDE